MGKVTGNSAEIFSGGANPFGSPPSTRTHGPKAGGWQMDGRWMAGGWQVDGRFWGTSQRAKRCQNQFNPHVGTPEDAQRAFVKPPRLFV